MTHLHNVIVPEDIRHTIRSFLQERLNNQPRYKSEKNRLVKAEQNEDINAIQESNTELRKLEKKYDYDNWLEDALERRIHWISVATHISKGIHSSSKGHNIIYRNHLKKDCDFIVSSVHTGDLPYDATGNAAALDIFALLNTKVINSEVSLMQLIMENHPAILPALSDKKEKAEIYFANIQKLLDSHLQSPKASELNKQIYWPINNPSYLSAEKNNYRLLIPLHPSSLCSVVFQKIQQRFSDENKEAREKRFKKNGAHKTYFTYADLAVVQLGGSNPQGVSLLNTRQGGKNYLLPSIPPNFSSKSEFKIKKTDKTLFSKLLESYCRVGFYELFSVVAKESSTVEVRVDREEALDLILELLFQLVEKIQNENIPGWTRGYRLERSQQCWLDPKRREIEGEKEFNKDYLGNWREELATDFALWMNQVLKKRFSKKASDFKDTELLYWRKGFLKALKLSLRNNEGIF